MRFETHCNICDHFFVPKLPHTIHILFTTINRYKNIRNKNVNVVGRWIVNVDFHFMHRFKDLNEIARIASMWEKIVVNRFVKKKKQTFPVERFFQLYLLASTI